MPRLFPKILQKIESVLGREAEVYLGLPGVHALSQRGCFTYSEEHRRQRPPFFFRLPSCWNHLAGDRPEDGIVLEAPSECPSRPLFRIMGSSWVMCAPLDCVPEYALLDFPVIEHNELPGIKTVVANMEDGRMCLTTPQGKFILNV